MARKKRATELSLWGEPMEKLRPTEVATRPRLIPLEFEGDPLGARWHGDVPVFTAMHACAITGTVNVSQAVGRLDEDEKLILCSTERESPGIHGKEPTLYVTEAGLLTLILTARARKDHPNYEKLRRFRRWVTHEVLPSIHRTGTYTVPKRMDNIAHVRKKLGCDTETAKARVDNCMNNRAIADNAPKSVRPYNPAKLHKSHHRGQFDLEFDEVCAMVDIKPGNGETPLDRMCALALIQNSHAKALTQLKAAQADDSPGAEGVYDLAERMSREIREADFESLGPGTHWTVRDDPRRGKIIDVGRPPKQLAAS